MRVVNARLRVPHLKEKYLVPVVQKGVLAQVRSREAQKNLAPHRSLTDYVIPTHPIHVQYIEIHYLFTSKAMFTVAISTDCLYLVQFMGGEPDI